MFYFYVMQIHSAKSPRFIHSLSASQTDRQTDRQTDIRKAISTAEQFLRNAR